MQCLQDCSSHPEGAECPGQGIIQPDSLQKSIYSSIALKFHFFCSQIHSCPMYFRLTSYKNVLHSSIIPGEKSWHSHNHIIIAFLFHPTGTDCPLFPEL